MSAAIQIIISSVVALLGAFFGARLAYRNMRQIEEQKVTQRRVAVGTVIQAELAHFYRELCDHNARTKAYCARVSGTIGATTAAAYPIMEIGERFDRIYQSVIPEIGLFDTDTSYGVVYCYANIFRFLRHQQSLMSELDGLINSSMLGVRVNNFNAQEAALLQQIERIIPLLAQQSRTIPFQPVARPRA